MGIRLENGSRVGVIGGGPAGSLFAYFLLRCARLAGLDLRADIYEPRDFSQPGPTGCNMCGGIVSESLVNALRAEGITLPSTVVQRGIDSYVLNTDVGTVRIRTPSQERRIAAIHRGGGPRDLRHVRWGSLDGHLLMLAESAGARVVTAHVADAGWDGGRPWVRCRGAPETYDLLVGATGVNSGGSQLYEKLGLRSKPKTARAYITELSLGEEAITRCFGSAMHIFLLDIPHLDCAAIIPKGDFVTICLLGRDIDRQLIDAFYAHAAVKRCFPAAWNLGQGACHCSPRINIQEAAIPFVDRVVLAGDCGVTRLYKDGLGAAYRTALVAARTAVHHGVSAEDFERHYMPAYRAIVRDNRFGRMIFLMVDRIKTSRPLLRAALEMTAIEQGGSGAGRRMSIVLWDMFTGGAPYRQIFSQALSPRLLARYFWHCLVAAT